MGRATDLYVRRDLVAYGVICWNIGILIMGLSHTFWELLLSRTILGIGMLFYEMKDENL